MNFTWKYGKNEIADCYFIRKKVFVEEQGFDCELEFDEIDDRAHHLLVCEGNRPIATARLFCDDGCYHCGRIAVLPDSRGKQIGVILMEELAGKAKALGATVLELSAQTRVVSFYEKAGYTKFGEEYMDEHCPHIRMKKTL